MEFLGYFRKHIDLKKPSITMELEIMLLPKQHQELVLGTQMVHQD